MWLLALISLIPVITASVNSNANTDVFQFSFDEAISAEFNKSLMTNMIIKNNIYLEFAMLLTKNAWRKPFQIDNVFHIGNENDQFYPAVFINIEQKRAFFKLSTSDDFDFIDVPHFDNLEIGTLYYIVMHKTQTNLRINVNDQVIYNKAANQHAISMKKALYLSNPWNNAANVNISNFTFISSNQPITDMQISNARNGDKYHYKYDENEKEDNQPLGTSFADIINWSETDVKHWLDSMNPKMSTVGRTQLQNKYIDGKNLLILHYEPKYAKEFMQGFKKLSDRKKFVRYLDALIAKMEQGHNTKNIEDETVHNDQCEFKGSFSTAPNVIVDNINIKSYFYVKFYIQIKEDIVDEEYMNYDTQYESDDDNSGWSLWKQQDQEGSKKPHIFNVLHVGDKVTIAAPSIDFDDLDNRLIFRKTGLNDEPTFKIEREMKYRIEIYETPSRFQIAVNKEIIYDTSDSYHLMIDNQPIYMSNPWKPSLENVKLSKFSMISSQINISSGDKLINYPYKYCLRSFRQEGQFDGIWTPNGTYNNHTIFYKPYLTEITNDQYVYLFYFHKSWRIYLEPYNMNDPLNPQKWFAICHIDSYNVLLCSRNFRFYGHYNKQFSIKAGDCYTEVNETDFIPTPEPTESPTKDPTKEPTKEPTNKPTVREKLWAETIWNPLIISLISLLLVMACLILLFTYHKIHQPKSGAIVIPFPDEGYYKTETFKSGGNDDNDDLETDCFET